MAGKIKGITIEFRGDTTALDKSLRKVNDETRGVDRSLKDVDRALKFNPKNTELLAQKQALLSQKISGTKEKLDLLRQAQAKLDDDPAVDKTSQEYMELRRQIIVTESQVKNFEAKLKEVDRVKFENLKKSLKQVGGKMKDIGGSMTQTVTTPIVAGYTLAAKYASDYEENLNKLDVAFGDNADSVKKWSETALEAYGMSKVQATDAAAAFGALGKGIGISEKDAAEMSTTLAGLSADLGSYFNTSTDESAKALEGIFTGESEALKKFGVVMTDTNLEKFASDQGLVWKEMDQTEKTMLRYQYVMDKTKDAQGDFSRTNDGTANSLKIFQSSLQDLGTSLGTVLLPIITPLVQKLSSLVQKFSELSPTTQKVITIIGIIVAALGPLLVVVGSVISAIGSIIALAPVIAGAELTMLGPIALIIAGIAALIAVGVLLYKNWDTIKKKAEQLRNYVGMRFMLLKEKIKDTFTKIKDAMIAPFIKARDVIKGIIDKIKAFFNFKVNLPHIKLPHFAIDPPGWKLSDLLQGVVPSLGIKWYKQGGIFNSPSVIGVGEAGPEAVLPIDKLQGMMTAMADNIVNGVTVAMAMQGAGSGEIKIPIYLYPSGPRMGEETVKMYDRYKPILG